MPTGEHVAARFPREGHAVTRGQDCNIRRGGHLARGREHPAAASEVGSSCRELAGAGARLWELSSPNRAGQCSRKFAVQS